MALSGVHSGYSNDQIDDLFFGTPQNLKNQNRNCAKNDLSKKLMGHYQKKYSIYAPKNSSNTEEKEYQVKGSQESVYNQAPASHGPSSEQA